MERCKAIVLYRIAELEILRGRPVYPQELAVYSSCHGMDLVREFLKKNYLLEVNENGKTNYHVSWQGIKDMEAYIDLRRLLASARKHKEEDIEPAPECLLCCG